MPSPLLEAFLAAAAVLAAATFLLWLVSLWKRDVSIIDPFWSVGFVIAAGVYRAWGPEAVARQWLALALVTVWGLRLGLYLLWRARGGGEDYRYREMREKRGPSFRFTSLFLVFWLQAALIAVISIPHLWLQAQEVPAGWRWSDAVALLLWAVGFFFETVGDAQMARFKADPSNEGKVLRSGLWRYTRHPNYFGDFCIWWGFFFLALGAPGGWWTLPAPLLMSFLLLEVSGVALLEKDIAERRPKYRDYVESTNAFFPGPPRKQEGSER